MPDPSMLIGAAAQGVSGIISLIAGAKQKKEGKGLLKKIGDETVPQELLENQAQAKSMANQGLPSEQYAMAMKNIQRQQLMALRGANDRRGGLASISSIQQGTNDATLGLDAQNAQARVANQRYAMGINSQVGNFKNQIWERKYNYANQLLGFGNQNSIQGFDKLGAGLGYGLSSITSGGGQGNEPLGGSGYNAPTYYRNVESDLYRNQGRRVG